MLQLFRFICFKQKQYIDELTTSQMLHMEYIKDLEEEETAAAVDQMVTDKMLDDAIDEIERLNGILKAVFPSVSPEGEVMDAKYYEEVIEERNGMIEKLEFEIDALNVRLGNQRRTIIQYQGMRNKINELVNL